jgi:pimeloyl-ACP methyl ester carboxylesterase
MNVMIKTIKNHQIGGVLSRGIAITREAGASVLSYELIPLSILRNQKKSKEDWFIQRRPILFLHGLFHNATAFSFLKKKLSKKGFTHFQELDLFTSLRSIPDLAEEVACFVEDIRKRSGDFELDIVGHSMGGLIARYYVQRLGGERLVRNLITLATPHQGTAMTKLIPFSHLRSLAPGSELLEELSRIPIPKKTQCTSIGGNLDIMVVPQSSTEWSGAKNIHLKGVGHAGLLFSRRVVNLVVEQLTKNTLPIRRKAA